MLLRFACSNFKSIKDRQEILFTAAKGIKGHEDSLIEVPGLKPKVLPVTAIYGPNASGKTNILQALEFMLEAIRNSQTDWKPGTDIPRPFHRLDPACADKVSGFELDFVFGGVRYNYGFTCTSKRIEQEWLYAYPKQRKQVWIERSSESTSWFGAAVGGEKEILREVTRDDSLVLSASFIVNNRKLVNLLMFFHSHFIVDLIIADDSRLARMMATRGAPLAPLLRNLIKHADVGISDYAIEFPGEADFENRLDALGGLSALTKKERLSDFISLTVDVLQADRTEAFIRHDTGGNRVEFDPEDESRGTRRWVALVGRCTFALLHGYVMVVDELESSLHPELCRILVQLFSDKKLNPKGAQLIFSTHNTSLMAHHELRRDEIWLTERDTEGATHVYPLSDFKISAKEDLEALYLDGRVGGLPHLSRLTNALGLET